MSTLKRSAWDERQLLNIFEKDPTSSLKFEDIAVAADVAPDELRKLQRMLKRLVNSGWLTRLKGKRYQLKKLPPARAKPSDAKPVLGLFRRVGKSVFIEPYDLSKHANAHEDVILIEKPHLAAEIENNSLVEYEIVKYATRNRGAFAEVLQNLGSIDSREVGLFSRILESGIPRDFPDEVMAQADALDEEVNPDDFHERKDLREIPLLTIDGSDAKDFDDAVCAISDKNGFKLFVAIADVSHYVQPDTPLDREAYNRSTSVYLTDRCIPMLPEKLSNGLCSLRPHVNRLCFVAELNLDKTGKFLHGDFYRAVMRSHARLTYTRVAAALDGKPDEECAKLLPHLKTLQVVAQKLLKRRMNRGSIDLDIPEPFIEFDEKGTPQASSKRPRNNAHRLIEDLMLAANEAVAKEMIDRQRDSMFRVHEDPDVEKLGAFVELANQLGLPLRIDLKSKPHPKDIGRMLAVLIENKASPVLQTLILRSLAQARYASENLGHFGLSAENYLHFTSPIRRYPDLVAHRLLSDLITHNKPSYSKEELDDIATECSQKERRAMSLERSCLDFDRCLIAQNFVGETFQATITAVKEFGFFAAIQDPFLEGLVPISSLQFDYFQIDEMGARLIGEHTGTVFMIAQEITVKLVRVDRVQGKIELHLDEGSIPETMSDSPRRRPKKSFTRGTERPRKSEEKRRGKKKRDDTRRGRGKSSNRPSRSKPRKKSKSKTRTGRFSSKRK